MALGYQDEVNTTDVAKRLRKRRLNKFGQTTTEEGGLERSSGNKVVGRGRSNTSRVGVGTLEKVKPNRKDMTGVNQTPITGRDVVRSVGKGALVGS